MGDVSRLVRIVVGAGRDLEPVAQPTDLDEAHANGEEYPDAEEEDDHVGDRLPSHGEAHLHDIAVTEVRQPLEESHPLPVELC